MSCARAPGKFSFRAHITNYLRGIRIHDKVAVSSSTARKMRNANVNQHDVLKHASLHSRNMKAIIHMKRDSVYESMIDVELKRRVMSKVSTENKDVKEQMENHSVDTVMQS